MSDRTYTFTFEGDDIHVESSDGMLDEDQAANILYWFVTEIKPYAPLAALSEMSGKVSRAMMEGR